MLSVFFDKNKYPSLIVLVVFFIVSFTVRLFIVDYNGANLDVFFRQIVNFIFVFFLFSVYLFVIRKNKLTKNNLFAPLLFVLFSLNFFEIYKENYFVLSCLFLSFGLRKIFSLKSQIKIKEKLFDAGLWIGLASIFFFWNIFFLILTYFALFLFKKNTFKNTIIPLVGVLISLFLYFTFVFIFRNELPINYFPELSFNYVLPTNKLFFTFPFFALTIFTIVVFTPKILGIKNTFQSQWKLLIAQFFIGILVFVFAKDKHLSSFLLLFPMALISSVFFERVSKFWIKDFVLIFLFVIVVVFGLFS